MIEIKILRGKTADAPGFWQSFDYEPAGEEDTVASALNALNARMDLRDRDGNPAEPIRWECSCLQKKCGACAMVVNGRPRLACDSPLKAYKQIVQLEPLRKFPVIQDLMVDRSVLFENLKQMTLWFDENAEGTDRAMPVVYEASRCLQCGCCLEVCPNFVPGEAYFGMAAAVPVTRLLAQLPEARKREISDLYRKHVYNGCGKSLACRDICPAGLDIENILLNSNAIAVWKRLFKK